MRRVAYLELAGRPGARFAARLAQDWRGVDLIVGLARSPPGRRRVGRQEGRALRTYDKERSSRLSSAAVQQAQAYAARF